MSLKWEITITPFKTFPYKGYQRLTNAKGHQKRPHAKNDKNDTTFRKKYFFHFSKVASFLSFLALTPKNGIFPIYPEMTLLMTFYFSFCHFWH